MVGDANMSHMLTFQAEVKNWLHATFPKEDWSNVEERQLRFIEEAIELVQAAGLNKQQVNNMVDYVYNRAAGAVGQEIGGVAVTFAALCVAMDLDMTDLADRELDRCWYNKEKIAAKQMRKTLRGKGLSHG